jgi:hypothetical protein
MLGRECASKHGRVQGAHTQRRSEARNHLRGGLIDADRQSMADDGKLPIVVRTRQHWHEWSAAGLDGVEQARANWSSGPRLGIGQDQGSRLDLLDGHAGVREARFDERKRSCLAKGLDQIGRPPLGHDHDRTQRCHADAPHQELLTIGIRC